MKYEKPNELERAIDSEKSMKDERATLSEKTTVSERAIPAEKPMSEERPPRTFYLMKVAGALIITEVLAIVSFVVWLIVI